MAELAERPLPVRPEVGIKSSPNFAKFAKKVPKAFFYFDIFQTNPKSCQIFWIRFVTKVFYNKIRGNVARTVFEPSISGV